MHDGGVLPMRLKYQLRGLGIGIILTAALLMAFSDDGEASAKTDDIVTMASTANEITQEAIETEYTSVSEVLEVETEGVSTVEVEETQIEIEIEAEKASEELSTQIEVVSEEILTEVSMTEEESISESVEEVAVEVEIESTEETVNKEEVVWIKIIRGDDSGTVARKIQTAGLVDNASEFDAYLMQHGYDKKISIGEVEIEKGSTWLEIAEKISGR